MSIEEYREIYKEIADLESVIPHCKTRKEAEQIEEDIEELQDKLPGWTGDEVDFECEECGETWTDEPSEQMESECYKCGCVATSDEDLESFLKDAEDGEE